MPTFSLMVHGGAGTLSEADDPAVAARYLQVLRTVLEAGRARLSQGAGAIDTVECCAALMEDDPLFNAGHGSVLNANGKIEMDAAIMNGRDLSAGAVAAVRRIANPVKLARRVLDESATVLYAAEGAERFAREHGVAQVPEDELITDNRRREFEKLRTEGSEAPANKFGTIGVVAIDRTGNLAAATSTGGMAGKPAGRVGDSPLIGAGTWADNGNCAVSCTGNGEDFIRTALARTAAALVELQGLDARDAAAKALDYLAKKVNGRGGLILIDRAGYCAAAFNTPRMIHGWIEHGGETRCRL